ncbi:hypothetical protein JCM8202_002926 [Rhodotorula sphaerocarpa]
MAHALLLSPATRFDSPDSSLGSGGASSLSLSPATPPPPSLAFLEDFAHDLNQLETPFRPATSTLRDGGAGLPANPLPEWLTDELGAQWLSEAETRTQEPEGEHGEIEEHNQLVSFVQDEEGRTEADLPDMDQPDNSRDDVASVTSSSATVLAPPLTPNSVAAPANRFAWQSQPRVPSSLRHGFTAASSPSTSFVSSALPTDGEHTRDMSLASSLADDGAQEPSYLSRNVDGLPGFEAGVDGDEGEQARASDGSIVVGSVVDRGSAAAGGGDNEQLQAAIRALKGPNAGLFATADEQAEADKARGTPQSRGLLGLFEPPSPPDQTPLPKSTRPAPTLVAFTFAAPDTSAHMSRSEETAPAPQDSVPSTPLTENDATPIARALPLATPRQRPVAAPSPTGVAVGKRDRFLKRSTSAAPEPQAEPEPDLREAEPAREEDVAAPSSDSESDAGAAFGFQQGAAHVPNGGQNETTTEDDETASSSDEEADEHGFGMAVRGPAGEQLLLGESQPGMGWSSDEDEGSSTDEEGFSSSLQRSLARPPPAAATIPNADRPVSPDALAPYESLPMSSTSGSRAASTLSSTIPPGSPLKLFQPTYDTVTRTHLAALVDEIDLLDQSTLGGKEASADQVETSEEGFLGDEGDKRSSKRIRLSPRAWTGLERVEELGEGDESREGRAEEGEGEENRSLVSPSLRNSLRISGPPSRSKSASSARPPPSGDSPPTLPKLAAAASASIRSALGSSTPQSPSLSHGVQAALRPEEGGSLGRRHFARTSLRQSRTALPAPASVQDGRKGPDSPGPGSKSAFHRIDPAASATKRLLASAGLSARDKGLVFDPEQGRWLRLRPSQRDCPPPGLEGAGPAEERSAEDPFHDWSDVADGQRGSSLSAPREDVEALRGGSGSDDAAVERFEAPADATAISELRGSRLELSGLGISQGTPQPETGAELDVTFRATSTQESPTPVVADTSRREAATISPSIPAPLPLSSSPEQFARRTSRRGSSQSEKEGHGADTAETTRATLPRPQRPASDDDSLVEASMLKLYRRAHAFEAPQETSQQQYTNAPGSAESRSREVRSASLPPAPRSVLKGARAQSDPLSRAATPMPNRVLAATAPPRSVSFSDGKTTGKIAGIGRHQGETGDHHARSSQELDGFFFDGHGRPGSLDFEAPAPAPKAAAHSSLSTISPSTVASSGSRSSSRTFKRTHSQNGNATFLTECSFGVTHDRLLQLITDVVPFEPDWEHLSSIDLSSKKADSLIRLKDFLPNLDEISLSNNEIAYLTGVPSSLRTLLAASNRLTDLTSFHHLSLLELLDISNNQLESVRHLASLRHLRELKADGNRIASIDGLADLDSLVRVSLKGNSLTTLDLSQTNWTRLETLHLARNRLGRVGGLSRLVSLTTLDLDHNALDQLDDTRALPRLRVLRLCSNPLTSFDISFAPKLRTLYVDSARLGTIGGTESLRKLENLSVRDQSGDALTLTMSHLRDVKRLYLSGNPLPRSFPSEKFFNLVYLELAMCQLTTLPGDLSAVIPNVRELNLNHNFLSDLAPLAGLARCTRLSVVGNRIAKARPVATISASLSELEILDLRMNPLTLAFYPPVVPSTDGMQPVHAEYRMLHPDSLVTPPEPSTLLDPTASSSAWSRLDTKFRRALPDEWYHRRAAYRTVLLQSVPTLVKLDGVDAAKERDRLAQRLHKLAAA